MNTAIVLAAGKSTRMGGGVDKAFISLVNKPVVAWSLLAFERSPEIDNIVLVVRKEQLLAAKAVAKMFGISKLAKIISGGTRRQDSVMAGLAACDCDTRFVIIHAAARPCVTPELVNEVMTAVRKNPAVTVGRPMIDTVKKCAKSNIVSETIPRDKLWQVQTPQAFQLSLLKKAYAALGAKADVTDDCQVVEATGETVRIVEFLHANLKITTPEDLQLASKILS